VNFFIEFHDFTNALNCEVKNANKFAIINRILQFKKKKFERKFLLLQQNVYFNTLH
jgi:hypothetical protein